jgi:hypothetical protein
MGSKSDKNFATAMRKKKSVQLVELSMSSAKQRAAARRNVKKAAAAAKSKKTISHLSAKTRTALGKQGAKVAREHREHS